MCQRKNQAIRDKQRYDADPAKFIAKNKQWRLDNAEHYKRWWATYKIQKKLEKEAAQQNNKGTET